MRKLLFFHADWCPPCKFYEKQFIKPLEDIVGSKYIVRVNAQNEPFKFDDTPNLEYYQPKEKILKF